MYAKKLRDEQLDQITDDWLRENDDYYKNTDKWKTKADYCYLTEKQLKYRQHKEIPLSNLFKNRLKEVERSNLDVSHLYEAT